MTRVKKTGVGVLAVALGLGGAFALAAVPDGSGVIHACVQTDPANGLPAAAPNVRVIDTAGAQSCNAGSELALNWNQTGAQGPSGPVGPAGPAGPAGANGTATITEPAPQSALAGLVKFGGNAPLQALSVSLIQNRGEAPRVVFTHEADGSSAKLMKAAVTGTPYTKVSISVYKPGTTDVASVITMTTVLIENFESRDDGDRLTDQVTLVGKTLKVTGTLLPAIQYQPSKKVKTV